MKRWDFEKRPYRPVHKTLRGAEGKEFEEQPDAFIDAMGRMWYAGNAELMANLPADPTSEMKIPPAFWHPDAATSHATNIHEFRKRQLEDERAESRRFGA